MSDKIRYTPSELKEFQAVIEKKLAHSREELSHLMESIERLDNSVKGSSFEDGVDVMEKEHLHQLAARTQKFIKDLEGAMFRIKSGTYGICKDTGKLIPRERLLAVPHTQQSIEAKRRQNA